MQDWNNDIERYKSGKMTSSERNALERKAMNDPFLADALDGIEELSADDFSKDLAALNGKILGTEKKSFWIPLRIAAGIFVVTGVSLTFYFLSKEDNDTEWISSNTETKADSIPADDNDSITKKPELLTLNKADALEANPESKEEASSQSRKSKQQFADTLRSSAFALKQTDVEAKMESASAPPALIPEPVRAEKGEEAPATKTEAEASEKRTLADAKQEETKVAPSVLRKALREEAEKDSKKKNSPSSSYTGEVLENLRVVTGKVTSAEDGSGLPGVNVIIKGTTKGTITDEEGNYRIELGAEKNPELSFTFIGTTTIEVPVNNQSNIDTQLAADVSQLSEVVVVGYGTDNGVAADDDFPTLIIAEPNGGRRAFKKYLETNIQYPQQALENKIEGKVTVQFTVTSDGLLNEFKVIKGIGSGCDEEVIRLIKQGPKWYPSRKGDAAIDSRMRVRMRFRLP